MEVFKYLGRLTAFDDDDTQAVRGNLAKARRVWARISRIFSGRERVRPRMWHVLQSHRVVCPSFWERNMGVVARHVTTSGRLPCKISAPDDRLAPKEGRRVVEVPEDEDSLSGCGHTLT